MAKKAERSFVIQGLNNNQPIIERNKALLEKLLLQHSAMAERHREAQANAIALMNQEMQAKATARVEQEAQAAVAKAEAKDKSEVSPAQDAPKEEAEPVSPQQCQYESALMLVQVEPEASPVAAEDEIFGDAETVSLGDSDDASDGFMTDEEYDILDASDEEAATSKKD